MTIYSPGGMPDGTQIQNLNINDIPSTRRNPVLADIFNRLGFMERQGSGLGKIIDAYQNAYNYTPEMEPTFFSNRAQFTVTLRNLNIGSEIKDISDPNNDSNLDPNQVSILKAIEENPKVTYDQLSVLLGVSRKTTQRIIKLMVEQNLIERIGGTRGYWQIKE